MANTSHNKLHRCCHDGNLKRLRTYVENTDSQVIKDEMTHQAGVFGYTPLHEAVTSEKAEVLKYLLEHVDGIDVNCRANSGYTPLHLAVSCGNRRCVQLLLDHGANMSCTDEYGKNAKVMAETTGRNFSIVKLLRSEELVQEIEKNGSRVTEFLRNRNVDSFEEGCLDRALRVAVKNDNHINVAKLVIKGAKALQEYARYSKEENKPHARAMLLLIIAAQTGDKAIIQKLFGEPAPGLQNKQDYEDDGFRQVQEAIISGNVSTVAPIEIARRNRQSQMREELLLKTDVNQEEGYVYWHGLRLLNVEISWLKKISWVKKFRLARNCLRTLPLEMSAYLKQVVKFDLQHNELSTVPEWLLKLPSLGELNLSSNKLTEFPNATEWSHCLTILDLSNNKLSYLPQNIAAPAIRLLNLAKNQFHNVPLGVCSFVTLRSLNLSDNPDIVSLPAAMGQLSSLIRLDLGGLIHLSDPPKNLQKDCRDCIRYLNHKLHSPKSIYRMKLMFVGCINTGKTTLVARLQGKEHEAESTIGVNVSEWNCCPAMGGEVFSFSLWDFSGHEDYYSTHQCFLSQHSLYLLLFNLKHGDNTIEELKPWLNNIALRAPHSCTIIVGTHLDEVPDEQRGEIDALLHRVGSLAATYNNKLQIVEVLPVGLKNRIENIGLLKEAIYNHAATYKTQAGQLIMGQKIPASYHALDKRLKRFQCEVKQGAREPIMHEEEFKTMLYQMNFYDIQSEEQIARGVLYLTSVGSLLHYDDHKRNLTELYFIDPQWLCDLLSKVVTTKERNSYIENGILHSRDIPVVFGDQQFPWKYFEHYIALLDRLEIALPIDSRRVLVPSKLPDERPKGLDDNKHEKEPIYCRIVTFGSANTPPGFWSRLLSRIMHSVTKVRFALDKSNPASDPVPSFNVVDKNLETEVTTFSMQPPTPADHKTNHKVNASSTDSSADVSATPFEVHHSKCAETGATFIDVPLGTTHLLSNQHLNIPPQLLPSYLGSFANDFLDPAEISLKYWRTGLLYKDPEVLFRVESLGGSSQLKDTKDGVLIMASANNIGKDILCQLVDLVRSLASEWYSGLAEGNNSLEEKVLCFECIKQGQAQPFKFSVEQCLAAIAKNEMTMECSYFHDNPSKNHTVSLADIVPDLLLQDIMQEFHLNIDEIAYQEDDTSFLNKGAYGKVYRGKFKDKSVTIKKYLHHSIDVFTNLRSDAKVLQQLHYPFLVCLVGVCIHPYMVLVLEDALLKSLDLLLLKKRTAVHRLAVFRIAAEVAAALRFLHTQGIVFRDLIAANVLVWSLDPSSLCHCKVASSSQLHCTEGINLTRKREFIAPEVLCIGKRKQCSVYDHRADVFSFGMLLYQMITRRNPYHNTPPSRIDMVIESGERPKLQDVDISHTSYHYLTQIMKACWEDNPKNRPDTDTIIKKICQLPTQMVLCVTPITNKYLSRFAIAIPTSELASAGQPESVLLVCSNGPERAEISMLNTHSMVRVSQVFLKNSCVHCMEWSGNYLWVGLRTGTECCVDIFHVHSGELVHTDSVPMHQNSVSCITATNKAVYLGTLEGYCFSFYNDFNDIQANVKPRYKYISECAVDGIVCTEECVWVAQTRYIHFLNIDNLAIEGSIHREKQKEDFIGRLYFDQNRRIVWSAHIGGVSLSAWDAHNKCILYDIDTSKHLNKIAPATKDPDLLITALTPALDTVWVGMASGHILVFQKDELLSWFHPYRSEVSFLTFITSAGPCGFKKGIVISGGKDFISLVDDLEPEETLGPAKEEVNISQSGTLIMWEAYEAKVMNQMELVAENSPNHLDNHSSVCRMIQQGEFTDGILELAVPDHDSVTESVDPTSNSATATCDTVNQIPQQTDTTSSACTGATSAGEIKLQTVSQVIHTQGKQTEALPALTNLHSPNTSDSSLVATAAHEHENVTKTEVFGDNNTFESDMPDSRIVPYLRVSTIMTESFKIELPDSEQAAVVRCPQPAKLNVLLSEVQMLVGEDSCQLQFQNDGKTYNLQTQKHLEEFLKIPNRPELCAIMKN